MKKHLTKLLSIVAIIGGLTTLAVSCSTIAPIQKDAEIEMNCANKNHTDQDQNVPKTPNKTTNPMTPATPPSVATKPNETENSNKMNENTNKNTNNPTNNPKSESDKNNMNKETTPYQKPSINEVFSFVSNNKLSELEEFLKRCNNIEIKNGRGQTLLLAATDINNIKAAELLLKYKANVNTQDNIQDSPFLLAGARGYTELVKLFLKHNPRFDIFNRYGGTGLIPAAEKRHLETVKVLLKVPNYPINHVNNLGWTALMEAIVLGSKSEEQTQIVKALIDGGVDITIPDRSGVSALQNAKRRELSDVVKLLEQKQKQLNS